MSTKVLKQPATARMAQLKTALYDLINQFEYETGELVNTIEFQGGDRHGTLEGLQEVDVYLED